MKLRSGSCTLHIIAQHILRLRTDGIKTWHRLKPVPHSPGSPRYKNLMHESLFAGGFVYGTLHWHDGVTFKFYKHTFFGLLEALFAHCLPHIPSNNRLVLIRVLVQIDPEPSNALVINEFGNYLYRYSVSSAFNQESTVSCVVFDSARCAGHGPLLSETNTWLIENIL